MSESLKWAEISIAAHGDAQEIVGALLTEVGGCQGYATTTAAVSAYLPVDDRLENTLFTLREALRTAPEVMQPEITLHFVAEEDWANAWKQYFKPQQIGEHLVVKPTWEEYDARPGDIVLLIDPGMAFGTGLHATTRLCLKALEDRVQSGDLVADVGTGSGILAVAAALLGAGRVVAVDNDPVAVRVAGENIAVNVVGDRVQATEAAQPPAGQFGIVVANILADVILGMADALYAATRPGGLLISSGIIASRATDVRRGLERTGFTIAETVAEGEWVAVLATRLE